MKVKGEAEQLKGHEISYERERKERERERENQGR